MPSSKARNRQSISEAISVSLGLQSHAAPGSPGVDFNRSRTISSGKDSALSPSYLGRSYMGYLSKSHASKDKHMPPAEYLPIATDRSRSIHESSKVHRETAALSNTFRDTLSLDENEDAPKLNSDNAAGIDELPPSDSAVTPVSSHSLAGDVDASAEEYTRLLSPTSSHLLEYGSSDPTFGEHHVSDNSWATGQHQYAARRNFSSLKAEAGFYLKKSLGYLPAVVLGLLLNILDALSYGMIIFPITEPVFSHLGTSGISMFYVSSIVSQLIFSGGFSSFGDAIGSEMIEITPFYHAMAGSIMRSLPGQDNEIISTTVVCYALSSMVTGIVFYLLGKMRLGKIVGFFPRHILIGCIGGVGYFLIITGFEVSTRVAKFEYNKEFLFSLFTSLDLFAKWAFPLALAVILILIQHLFDNSLVLPTFYIVALVLFHFIVAIVPGLSLEELRKIGWIFDKTSSSEQWYDFYRLYNFKAVQWSLVLQQLPTMLALTFFGILHVPINVPALAISVGVDKFDVDKELIAHGYSNFFSGLIGSVQNYLVYTNSMLFIRAGADSSLAGLLLALATFGVMVTGPVIVSFIPICIVGSLIFLLGYELIKEALYDTWGKLNRFEYLTVVIIVFTMGVFDFVLGIIVGILIACFSFLVDSTKLQTINGEFDGQVARSTVSRDFIQTKLLNKVGDQIYVLKLQNLLFFGTIISIEEKIDKLLELSEKNAARRKIKYLILDFKNINADNIDYSAAEGFNRIKRFTISKRIQLIISSITEWDSIYTAFNKVGLLDGVELFGDLNNALEWCENEFLRQYGDLQHKRKNRPAKSQSEAPKQLLPMNTPRNTQFVSAVQKLYLDEQRISSIKKKYLNDQPVLSHLLVALKAFRPRLMSADKDAREAEERLWSQLGKYFTKKRLAAHSVLLHQENVFFLIESGMMKVKYNLLQGQIYEILASRTCCGRISSDLSGEHEGPEFFVEMSTETDCSIWIIDTSALHLLRSENLPLFTELLLLCIGMQEQRLGQLLGYCLVSS
ncbi:LAMI_0H04280g1_1 [Lachancea mirantina]|uniref:LAMI_0H04280g1_1 n=1 Tax=Lachancea mirantina TaxID=1230905 RepID=A0A1G4KEQ7_9SACH|nr:LAMI_0H04280g1_1 [Lachancea mirantina]